MVPPLLAFLLLFAVALPAQAGERVLALFQDSHPKYFLDNPIGQGICGDIYLRLAQRLSEKDIHLELSTHFTPIKRILALIERGEAGMYCGAGRNKAREAKFAYSAEPVYPVANVLVARADDAHVPASFDALAASGDMIGGYYGTSSTTFLMKQPGIKVDDRFVSLEEGLQAVVDGRRIRYFFYHDMGLYYLVKTLGQPLQVLPTKFRSYSHWMIYSRKLAAPLRGKIDAQLAAMKEAGEIDEILRRYRP